jgi:hypothetical protein
LEVVEIIRRKSNEATKLWIAGTNSPNTPGYLEQAGKI